MANYVTTILVFVCAELRPREASSFCDFFFIIKKRKTCTNTHNIQLRTYRQLTASLEWCYCSSKMFRWEPERRYHSTKSGNSALLVLNGTSLNCNKALQALNWRQYTWSLYFSFTILKSPHFLFFHPKLTLHIELGKKNKHIHIIFINFKLYYSHHEINIFTSLDEDNMFIWHEKKIRTRNYTGS